MGEDKRRLERLMGREIRGFALPFHGWNEEIRSCAIACGFTYARISEESGSYDPPEDFFSWKAGIFHLNPGLEDYVEGFLASDRELALCQIVGHSYDLDVIEGWERMAELLRQIASDPDTVSMTNLELADYLGAMAQAVVEEDRVENPSDRTLWFRRGAEVFSLLAGERKVFEMENQ